MEKFYYKSKKSGNKPLYLNAKLQEKLQGDAPVYFFTLVNVAWKMH